MKDRPRGFTAFVLPALAALAVTACSTTTVTRYSSLTSAGAAETMGFGLGHVSSETSAFGHSESLSDTRVEHAADRGDGTRDRIWHLALGPVPIPGLSQTLVMPRLELCDKGVSRQCTPATWVDGEGRTSSGPIGMPVLVEGGMLGWSSRVTRVAGATMYGTVESTTASGVVREVEPRRATPAFGVWTLSSPVTTHAALFAVGTGGGAPAFCHAPDGGVPRCVPPSKPPLVERVLAVDVVRRGGSFRHVLWYQGIVLPSQPGDAARPGRIVRCEADDATAAPTCESTEVNP